MLTDQVPVGFLRGLTHDVAFGCQWHSSGGQAPERTLTITQYPALGDPEITVTVHLTAVTTRQAFTEALFQHRPTCTDPSVGDDVQAARLDVEGEDLPAVELRHDGVIVRSAYWRDFTICVAASDQHVGSVQVALMWASQRLFDKP